MVDAALRIRLDSMEDNSDASSAVDSDINSDIDVQIVDATQPGPPQDTTDADVKGQKDTEKDETVTGTGKDSVTEKTNSEVVMDMGEVHTRKPSRSVAKVKKRLYNTIERIRLRRHKSSSSFRRLSVLQQLTHGNHINSFYRLLKTNMKSNKHIIAFLERSPTYFQRMVKKPHKARKGLYKVSSTKVSSSSPFDENSDEKLREFLRFEYIQFLIEFNKLSHDRQLQIRIYTVFTQFRTGIEQLLFVLEPNHHSVRDRCCNKGLILRYMCVYVYMCVCVCVCVYVCMCVCVCVYVCVCVCVYVCVYMCDV